MPIRARKSNASDIGQIEMRPVGDLKPYAKNPRQHPPASLDAVATSIRTFGFRNPILVGADDVIAAGHARWEAAKMLGLAEVPTLRITGLTKAQIRAYVMADNATAERSTWSEDLLRFELGELQDLDFDISTIGFSDDFLADLLADRTEGLTDPDDVPDVPEEPVTRAGDLWIMGRHRLLCGDATVEPDVKRLLKGVEPHLMVTDPPYGVEYDGTWRDGAPRRAPGKSKRSYVPNDDVSDWSIAWHLFAGDVAYVWSGSLDFTVLQGLKAAGFELRSQIIWRKDQAIFSRGHYHWQHETCWYAIRSGGSGHWSGDRKQTTVWAIGSASGFRSGRDEPSQPHGAQKPVECMRRPIENNSSPGQAVYDPFLGSGTSIIAAEQTGRACLALEIAPQYVDVSVQRWMDFTGKESTLDNDGRTFAEVAAERLPEKAAA